MSRIAVVTGSVFCLVVSGAIAHEVEINIGRNTAGQLVMMADLHHAITLPVSIFPGFPGYAAAEPAFHSAPLDIPAEDFFQLSPASHLRWMLLSKTPGLEVFNDTGTGYMNVGETHFLGPPAFDSHPIWNITSGNPGEIFTLSLKVIDMNGIYTESAPMTIDFTPAPEPAAAVLFLLGAGVLTSRRRPRI